MNYNSVIPEKAGIQSPVRYCKRSLLNRACINLVGSHQSRTYPIRKRNQKDVSRLMAENNVSQWKGQDQSYEDMDWEEESYREGCAYVRERAAQTLKTPDDQLLKSRPRGFRVEGFRERTVVTRFGDVVVRRRMYRDQEGKAIFALDEHLGWKAYQQTSPSLTECMVSIASIAFRVVARLLSALTAGVLSAMTISQALVKGLSERHG